MKHFCLVSTLVLSLLAGNNTIAQDFSNKGKDFWVAYGYHQIMNAGNAQQMVLYFATEQVTTVTVSIPGLGYSQTYTNIPPNTVFTSNPIPKVAPQDARLTAESFSPENKGIHITSDKAIVAYAHIYNQSVSGATILFPTNTLGKEYYSLNYTNISNSANANCWFYVVACDTGSTTVEITPSAATIGHPAGVPFTVNMTQGQVYNLMGQLTGNSGGTYTGVDLTGSTIKSISTGPGGCKKIAVFSGSGRISITCNAASSSSDNYMVQAFPKTAWGKKYLTVSSGGSQSNNIYRVCVADPSTFVKLNGFAIPYPLINNFYYEIPASTTPKVIEADKPIMVAQYFTSQGACGNGSQPGDPEVIYLSPVEQNISKVLWNATPNFAITQHYFNVVIPNSGSAMTSFKLDGFNVNPASFTPHPGDPSYSYLVMAVSAGQHTIQSDSGFNAIAYGYGNAESYGYNAGTNIRDLYRFLSVQNEYGTVNFGALCKTRPFHFSMVFPYEPTQIQWVFGPALNALGILDTTLLSPVYDSTWFVSGKQLYRYRLPSAYTIPVSGLYSIRVIAQNPTPDGCGGIQDIDFDIQVYDLPIADFTFSNSGCITNPVSFLDNSNSNGRTVTSWYWNFDDGGTASTQNASHTYAAAGSYNVKHSVITDIGCKADTVVKVVSLSEPATAHFTVGNPNCPNVPVQFTDASTVTSGNTITQWDWNFGDIGSGPNNTSSLQNPSHTFSASGVFIVTLKVTTSSGCLSAPYTYQVTIHSKPIADFSYPAMCLPNTIPFTDLSTISGGGESITSWAWDFGDGGTSTAQNPSHAYAGGGPYTVTLIATSNNGCSDTKILTVNSAGSSPQAAFTAPLAACINNAVSFTDNSTVTGSTIAQWSWNFGDPASGGNNTSTLQNPAHTFSGPGTYTVTLNVTSAQGCTSVVNPATHQVLVNSLPTASISGAITVCQNASSPMITFSGTGGLAPYTFTFTINGGSNQVIATSSGNSITLPVPTGTAGTFTYALVSVQEGSAAACNQSQAGTVTVVINPSPTAAISGTADVCLNAPSPIVTFTGSNGVAPYTFTYKINGGPNQIITTSAGNSVTIPVATGTAGTYTYTLVSVQEGSTNGCSQSQSGLAVITVKPLPTAAISGTVEACLNGPSPLITFTGANGTAPYTFTYKINGGPNQFVTTSSGNSVTVPAPTGTAGTFTYTLVNVQEGSANSCSQSQTGSAIITIKPLPTASISGNSTVCLNASSPLITFTGANGTAPYTFTYTINGGANQVVTTSSGNSVTVSVPTNTAGTFTYALVSVQEGSGTSCSQSQTGSVAITVKPLPTATVSGTIDVCLNSTQPIITFTGANGTAPYTFTYKINGGPSQMITTASGNSVTVSVPTNTAGTYIYSLVNIQEGSANSCSQLQSGSATVIVKPLPTATISAAIAEACLNNASPNITLTGANGTAPYTFTYTINGGSNQVITTASGNSITIPVPTGTAGTYIYSLINVQEGSANTCSQAQAGSATVTINPLPTANFTASVPSCETSNITFTDASLANAGNITKWTWDYGDATNAILLSGNPFTHVYATANTYNVKLTVETNKGCVSTMLTKQVIVNVRPDAGFIAPQICLTDPIASFTDTSKISAGTVTGWLWNFGDGGTSTLQNPSHPYATVGTKTVTLIITSNQGCKDTISQSFVVNGSIPVAAFVVQNQNTLCSNQAVNITDGSTVDFGSLIRTEIYWDYNNDPTIKTVDNSPLNGRAYTHSYTEFGSPASKTYTIRYITYSGLTCMSMISKTITLLATPTLRFDPVTPACSNAASFQITQAQLLNGLSGAGVFSGTGVSSTGLFNTAAAGSGSFTIRYTYNANNGCSNYAEQIVNIYPTPGINAGPDKVVLEGGVVQLTPALNIGGPPSTFLWTPSTGLSDPTNPYTNASPVDDITYVLTVRSDHGCTASDQIFVKVLRAPVIPNIFSPNSDGVHDKWVISYLETYPGCTVAVYNRYGQQIFHSVGYSTPWDGTVHGKPVPVGTYYYIVDPKNGRKLMTGYVDVIR